MRKVDLDKIPARTKSAGRAIRDKEEPIWGQGDCSVEGSAVSRERRKGQGGRRADRSGNSSRDRSNGRKWRGRTRGTGIRDAAKGKQRQVICRQG